MMNENKQLIAYYDAVIEAYKTIKAGSVYPLLTFIDFLTLLLVKHLTECSTQNRLDVVVDNVSEWETIFNEKNHPLAQSINKALIHLTEKHPILFDKVFVMNNFETSANFANEDDYTAYLESIVTAVQAIYDMSRPFLLKSKQTLGSAVDHLMTYGNIFPRTLTRVKPGDDSTLQTPTTISHLMAALINVKNRESIYDPSCGYGGLLAAVCVNSQNAHITMTALDVNPLARSITKLRLMLHGKFDAIIRDYDEHDTSISPSENNKLSNFDVAFTEPRSATYDKLEKTDNMQTEKSNPYDDIKESGNYLFIRHMLEKLNKEGRMAIVTAHGPLYQGGFKAEERKYIIENNLLDAVIGLPSKLYDYTSVPVAIMILKKNRKDDFILFVDATNKDMYRTRNYRTLLTDFAHEKIISTYENPKDIPGFSACIKTSDIIESDYYLNIGRYIQPRPQHSKGNDPNKYKIDKLEQSLKDVRQKIRSILENLDIHY